jgi:hypothetical protein
MLWRDLPDTYGPSVTACNRFQPLVRVRHLEANVRRLAPKSRDSLHSIDSTIVKAHRTACGAKKGGRGKELVSAASAVRRNAVQRLTEGGDR